MSGRVVLITGAAGALGRAVAERFASEGDRLALLDQVPMNLEAAYQGQCDLGNSAETEAHAARIVSQLGRIDILLNIAGGFEMGEPVHATSEKTWRFMFEVNLWTLVRMLEAVVPIMREQGAGRIVNMGARAALRGSALMGAYAASKSAVIRLTESLSDELKESGVQVNCILPSVIDTPRNRSDIPDADFSRWVQPQRIAEVMAFLVSDGGADIHGASIPVESLS
ncbi:MAG: SDR family NAD(P)-dependent oxidoreductase [Gammaproteobacteria bacterium]|nr:SDR family NAD(P)-dependent oxidoreductase [Gammaproteobacteria bacterium]